VKDTYSDLVNSPFGGKFAKALGLPRPAKLHRFSPGDAVSPGPILIVDADPTSRKDGDHLAEVLLEWDLDVRRHSTGSEKFSAIIGMFTGVTKPADISSGAMGIGGTLRSLRPNGRVITISRTGSQDPETGAAQQGVTGMLRSLAKEMRGGSTANGITIDGEADSVSVTAPSAIGALRFLLSGKSAFVSGQFIEVDSESGELPQSWEKPLAGKVAAVTGAARGIGASIARTLARDGATVVAVDVPQAGDHLARVANSIRGTALQLDVTADDAGERLLDHALARHDRLDIVVHNAGITRDKLLANMDEDRWDSVIGVNVTAPLHITEQLLASKKLGDQARIIGLASTSGVAGNRGQTNYATSKAGVMGMVATYADRLPKGSTANAVAPGFIETEMTARMPAVTRQVARRLNSLQQGGLPVDVAEAIAFLSSPQSGGISGTTLRVCGQNMVGA